MYSLLLVEDQQVVAFAERIQLEERGYTVEVVTTADEAIEKGSKSPYDLILMDIDLGDKKDGTYAATEILKEREIPIVFLSNYTDQEVVGRTEEITSYGYVVKDTGITVLDASIKMAMKLYSKNEELREKDRLLVSITDNYPNSFISVIEDDFTVGFTAGAGFKQFGIDPTAQIGLHLTAVFGEHADFVIKEYKKTFDGRDNEFELVLMGLNLLFKTSPIVSEDGKVRQIVSAVVDISKYKN